MRRGQGDENRVVSMYIERYGWFAAKQRVEPGSRQIGVPVESDHMFRQAGERDLGFQDVLLRYLPDRVLDARSLDGLARNFHMLIVNPQFVLREQQVVEGLVRFYANLQANLIKLRFGEVHIGLCHVCAQRPLARSRQRLADAEHVLRLVVIPGLFERHTPSAIHRHGVIERTGSGNVCLRNGDSPGCHRDLRVLSQCDPLHFFQRQRRAGRLGFMMLLEQCGNSSQAIGLRRRLSARNAGHSGYQNAKY